MDRRRQRQLDRLDRPARAALPHCKERNVRPWLAEPRACRLRGRPGPAGPVVRCNMMYLDDFRELSLAGSILIRRKKFRIESLGIILLKLALIELHWNIKIYKNVLVRS